MMQSAFGNFDNEGKRVLHHVNVRNLPDNNDTPPVVTSERLTWTFVVPESFSDNAPFGLQDEMQKIVSLICLMIENKCDIDTIRARIMAEI